MIINLLSFLLGKLIKMVVKSSFLCYDCTVLGEIAQLARASGSYPEGRGFDPLSRYQMKFNLTL